jgi:hypothetical protein
MAAACGLSTAVARATAVISGAFRRFAGCCPFPTYPVIAAGLSKVIGTHFNEWQRHAVMWHSTRRIPGNGPLRCPARALLHNSTHHAVNKHLSQQGEFQSRLSRPAPLVLA